jgi:mannose-6-phosphate isomerase-like protein (cupin superfamily)
MKTIADGEETYAILVEAGDKSDGHAWFGGQFESLQAAKMIYQDGKRFKIHHHILNPRTIKKTQEAFVVISGRLAVDVYDKDSHLMGTLEAGPGEAVFVYRGGHGVRILEDTVAYEIKAGAYTLVSEDKEFLNG